MRKYKKSLAEASTSFLQDLGGEEFGRRIVDRPLQLMVSFLSSLPLSLDKFGTLHFFSQKKVANPEGYRHRY
ncbi:MAG: hypothetical protein AAF587_27230 [Bacteroidota bacterium]